MSNERPNVLVIFDDQHRHDAMQEDERAVCRGERGTLER